MSNVDIFEIIFLLLVFSVGVIGFIRAATSKKSD